MSVTVNDFNKYSRYTVTYVAAFNWSIDYISLFQHIRIPKLAKDPLQGVKKNNVKLNLPIGTVLRVKYKDVYKNVHVRGYGITEGEGAFRNSATVVMYIGKIVVLKVPSSGKIHIAGCRTERQVYQAIHAIWNHIQHIRKVHPDIVKMAVGEMPKVIFSPVMNNISINMGFSINKKKVHEFLYKDTEFLVIPNDRKYAGVAAKLEVEGYKELPLVKHRFLDGKWYASNTNWTEYLSMLKPKDRIKEEKAERYHTFLIFFSGRVIQTGPRYELMEDVFKYFVSSINGNRPRIEDLNVEVSKKGK